MCIRMQKKAGNNPVHMNNKSGTKVSCVECHLPPVENTLDHYTAKAKLGLKDVWGYLTKDSADFNWDESHS